MVLLTKDKARKEQKEPQGCRVFFTFSNKTNQPVHKTPQSVTFAAIFNGLDT